MIVSLITLTPIDHVHQTLTWNKNRRKNYFRHSSSKLSKPKSYIFHTRFFHTPQPFKFLPSRKKKETGPRFREIFDSARWLEFAR